MGPKPSALPGALATPSQNGRGARGRQAASPRLRTAHSSLEVVEHEAGSELPRSRGGVTPLLTVDPLDSPARHVWIR